MAFYLVELKGACGESRRNGIKSMVVETDSAAKARAVAAAKYDGDASAWGTSGAVTVTEVAAGVSSDYEGCKFRVKVGPDPTGSSHKDIVDVEVELASGVEAASAVAINAGGTGYVTGDVLTVSGGTATSAVKLEVTSVAAGVIDGIKIVDPGQYTAKPSNPVAVTGGTGNDDATFNLTWEENTITVAGGALVAALNATDYIAGAEYDPDAVAQLLVAAGSGVDDLGDHLLVVEITPDGFDLPVAFLVGTITSGGVSTDDLAVVLDVGETVIPAVFTEQ